MPNYTREGKLTTPITDKEFLEGMKKGKFVKAEHKAYIVLLYYSAVRRQEALNATRESFQVTKKDIVFDVGKRLKHGLHTPPLKIPRSLPYAETLATQILETEKGQKVFGFCGRTAYRVVRRVFFYPHFFRLSRITNFFLQGWTIAQVRSWTGLTLVALNYYIGLVDIDKMSRGLK